MTWNLVLFLMGLLLSAVLLSLLTVQVNAFEQKLNNLIAMINKRYDLEILRQALEEEKRKIEEKAKKRANGG